MQNQVISSDMLKQINFVNAITREVSNNSLTKKKDDKNALATKSK